MNDPLLKTSEISEKTSVGKKDGKLTKILPHRRFFRFIINQPFIAKRCQQFVPIILLGLQKICPSSGVFRTLSKYSCQLFREIRLKVVNYFSNKATSFLFDSVINTLCVTRFELNLYICKILMSSRASIVDFQQIFMKWSQGYQCTQLRCVRNQVWQNNTLEVKLTVVNKIFSITMKTAVWKCSIFDCQQGHSIKIFGTMKMLKKKIWCLLVLKRAILMAYEIYSWSLILQNKENFPHWRQIRLPG